MTEPIILNANKRVVVVQTDFGVQSRISYRVLADFGELRLAFLSVTESFAQSSKQLTLITIPWRKKTFRTHI